MGYIPGVGTKGLGQFTPSPSTTADFNKLLEILGMVGNYRGPLTEDARDDITGPALYEGLMLYNLDKHQVEIYDGTGWVTFRTPHTEAFSRQMSAVNNINDQITYVDFPVPADATALSGTFVKRALETKLIIRVSGSAELQAGLPQRLYFGVRIGTTDYDVAQPMFPAAIARVHFSREIVLTGVTPGSYPVKARIRSATAAQVRLYTDDFVSYSITETM